MDKKLIEQIKLKNRENEKKTFSPHATLSSAGIRISSDEDDFDVRSRFSHDTDRIIHSPSYTRYLDRTQVFYFVDNDKITYRVLHVQLVSKIGREIGRELSLNEDLIEAIALGHDIGHPPFGHEGEDYLNLLSKEHGIGIFSHNLQSIRALKHLEKSGEGLNLTLQVLDGILCHNGELLLPNLSPKKNKTWEDHEAECIEGSKKIVPMTLEGCVVRFADIIGYIGRDIEDAISLNLIERNDIPKSCSKILGKTNREIINTLVLDIVETSFEKEYIGLSEKVFKALMDLKDFNYKAIYSNEKIKTESNKIKSMYTHLFTTFLNDLRTGNKNSHIYKDFYEKMSDQYKTETSLPLCVRDFISGITDKYFINAFKSLVLPGNYGYYFVD
jgi:dGTPase